MVKTAVTAERIAERQLIGRASSGERAALRELVDRHKDRLFAFIWRMVRHHHDAEEICQEAFLKAFASLDRYSPQYRFSTWLFTIGYRVCLNHLRRRRFFTGEVDFSELRERSPSQPTGVLESKEVARLKQMVWSAVDRLTAPQRAALLLFYRQDLNCQEIARVMEIPVATVKSHLHRGRNRLRELLEGVNEEDLHEFRNRSGTFG